MKKFPRLFLLGVQAFMLLTTACAEQQGSPTVPATMQATSTPTITVTSTSTLTITVSPTITVDASIPVTGPTTASLVCQFCMDTFTYVLLDIPAAATYTLLPPTDVSVGCNAVEIFRDRQLLLCHAPSNTSLSMNVCQGNDCHQFTVRLQICPPPTPDSITPTWTPVAPMTPVLLTPVSSPTSAGPPVTPDGPIVTATGDTATPTVTISPTVTP